LHLTQVQVYDYGPFEDATVDLLASGVILIAGPNNSGKTVFLSALDLLAGRVSRDVVRRAGSDVGPRIRAQFSLTVEEQQLILGDDFERLSSEKILSAVDFHFEGTDPPTFLNRITCMWPGAGEVNLVWNHREPNGSYAVFSVPFTGTHVGTAPGGAHAFGTGGGPIDISGLAGIGGVGVYLDLLNQWRSAFYHFFALRPGTQPVRSMSATRTLEPTGANLPEVLLWLLHNEESVWGALQNLMSEIIPEVGRLVLPVEGNKVQVAFEDPYVPAVRHNLKNLGTGVEQLLMTVVVGLTHPAPSLVIIEEPETNLHPGAQRALLTLLEEWSENRAFVVSTHSATMLDWTYPERIWLASRSVGSSTITRSDQDPSSILTGLGVRLSDVLSAERILLVEGNSDKAILEAWFPVEMRNPTVAVIPARGGEDARLASIFEDWLSKADRIQRKMLFLRDRDELPEDLISKLQASQTVYVLDRREIENYLLDTVALTEALNKLRRSDQEQVTLEAMTAALRSAIDRLQRAVIVGRVCRQLELIRPADNTLRRHLMKTNADLSELTQAVVERLPDQNQFVEHIAKLWRDAEVSVGRDWPMKGYYLAPGEDVLDLVFMELIGRRYRKNRDDGVEIARCMQEPPEELANILRRFLA